MGIKITVLSAPVSAPKSVQSIQGIVSRVRDDPNIPEEDKIETLCMLLQKFVEENQGYVLKYHLELGYKLFFFKAQK